MLEIKLTTKDLELCAWLPNSQHQMFYIILFSRTSSVYHQVPHLHLLYLRMYGFASVFTCEVRQNRRKFSFFD